MLVGKFVTRQPVEIYHANTFAQGSRKATQDSNSGIEPLFGSLTVALGLNELLSIVFLVKYLENICRRVAILQLGCELMCKKVILRLLFIVVQGSIENGLEIGS
jgi:hypothetical protein